MELIHLQLLNLLFVLKKGADISSFFMCDKTICIPTWAKDKSKLNVMKEEQYIFEYYLTIVKPTVEEFLQHKSDLRRGRLAAIVLDHMRDYLAIRLNRNHEWSITEKLLKEEIYEYCPDVALIRDVCNATKHGVLRAGNENNKIPKNINSTDQIKAESNDGIFIAGFSSGMFQESNYVYIKFDKEIEYLGKKIGFRFLHDSIIEVVKYWDNLLQNLEKSQ